MFPFDWMIGVLEDVKSLGACCECVGAVEGLMLRFPCERRTRAPTPIQKSIVVKVRDTLQPTRWADVLATTPLAGGTWYLRQQTRPGVSRCCRLAIRTKPKLTFLSHLSFNLSNEQYLSSYHKLDNIVQVFIPAALRARDLPARTLELELATTYRAELDIRCVVARMAVHFSIL